MFKAVFIFISDVVLIIITAFQTLVSVNYNSSDWRSLLKNVLIFIAIMFALEIFFSSITYFSQS